jgi:hypothetical protein
VNENPEEIVGEFEEGWRRFQASDTVRLLHETLEWEWTRGRTDYVAFLLQPSEPEVRAHIARAIEAIEGIPGVDPYPERYWHVTIKGVGFLIDDPTHEDEVSPDEVQRISDAARPILESHHPFRAEIGRPNAFAEVVYLEVLDGGIIRSLNEHLLEGVPGIARQPVDGAHFLPHISIARFSSAEGLDELKNTLAGLRAEAPPAPVFTVRDALLVQAHLAAEAPTFDLLALYELGA